MNPLDAEAARDFCSRWLPAWTGNRPVELAAFYSADAFYRDPGVPDGLHGRDALAEYFTRLLARFPDWVWTHTRSIPLQDGFVNFWHARIPVGAKQVEVDGVCTVQLDADGLICRNEVYFDRSELLKVLAQSRGPDPEFERN